MKMKLVIKNGHVIDPANQIDQPGDVLIEDGKIAALANHLEADAPTIDATGKVVAPGLVDMHVHLREPGYEYKETIATGTRSAALGGVTSVAAMPNTNPPLDNQAAIRFVREKAHSEGVVNVYPIGNITKGGEGKELAEIGDLYQAGAVAISDDGKPVMNAEVMRHAMEYARIFKLPVISHCEDINLAAGGVMHEGYMSTMLGLKGIPAAAETVMIARDLMLAKLTGAHIHIAHVSTQEGVELIRQAKRQGINVTAEVTPHHLTLTEENLINYDTNLKVNPPLRTAADVAALVEGLQDGTLDVIATDHAPHAIEEKEVEFNNAYFGMVGLETLLPLVITKLVQGQLLSLPAVLAKLTVNPARILGIAKGTLGIGADADILIFDPQATRTVDVNSFASKGKNSPFHGWTLQGVVDTVLVGGVTVVTGGKLCK